MPQVNEETAPKKFPDLKKSSKYRPKYKGSNDTNVIKDARFAHLAYDPKYRSASRKETKIKIDERFKGAFTKEEFNISNILDPRGKPRNYTTRETLEKFYDLESENDISSESSEESEEEEEESDEQKDDCIQEENDIKTSKSKNLKKTKTKSAEDENTSEKFMQCLLDPEKNLARGELFYSDDSSDDDSSTTDEDEENDINVDEFEWGELDRDAEWDVDGTEVEETKRIAICNMDWDRIKAVDLMVLLSSFAPPGGKVEKISIIPSEFGKKRMKEEEQMGPQELVNLGKVKTSDSELKHLDKIKKGILSDSNVATATQIEALRRYQRNRLLYYYAVALCDSVETASKIYKEVDQTHYEIAGINVDLRYIPDDMEFDEVPRDECSEVPGTYKSEIFQTTALTDTKPILTWDETDYRRKKTLSSIMAKALKKENFDEDDLKNYIASSDSEVESESEIEEQDDSEEGEEKESRIAKFRALISEIDEKEKKKEELTFDKEETFTLRDSEGEEENKEEVEDTKQKEKNDESLTPFEKFLVKKKEKKKEKIKKKNILKKENEGRDFEEAKVSKKGKTKVDSSPTQTDETGLSLLVMDEEESDKKHFDMKKIREEKLQMAKKKRKRAEAEDDLNVKDDFKIDSADPRFAALFTHSRFNLDPSHPKYDPGSSLNTVVAQKSKIERQQQSASNSHLDSDISHLVKKIKSKTLKPK